jgi:hypothetical protein
VERGRADVTPAERTRAVEVVTRQLVEIIAGPIPISVRVERAPKADAIEVFLVHGIGPSATYRKIEKRLPRDSDYGRFFEELSAAVKEATKGMLSEMIPDLVAG